jgi:hypothetical protein
MSGLLLEVSVDRCFSKHPVACCFALPETGLRWKRFYQIPALPLTDEFSMP